ncbi:hypothetical protein DICSQDRAFT_164186, partial [Dichomitus squalens LYAD-421 SS1]
MLSEAPDTRSDVGDEPLDGMPSSSSSHTALLPAFGLGLHKKSHLPTPQSPSNVAVYAPNMNGAYTSPVHHLNRDVQRSHVQRKVTPARDDISGVPAASFMTPESSPLLPRKMMPPESPVAGPSSIPHTPLRHELAGNTGADHATSQLSVDTVISPLAPAPIITTPVSARSRDMTPASRLSSPFLDRLSATDRRSVKSQSKSPMPISTDSPMADVFSATPRPSTPPPLATPVPKRALGGEMQRIHLQLAADRAERLAEMEARRPEYLVREKRPRSEADIPTLDELDAANATLGVTETPMKGRRLQLFQATSEETFEQSLLAGGYPGYGQSPAYKNGEPQTPLPHGKSRSSLSQRALHWFQQATPGQPGPSTTIVAATAAPSPAEEPVELPSEQEIRKRRRLDAFREHPEKKEAAPKLYPVEVEGRGRLLLDVPPEGTVPVHARTPVKRRPNKRKRRRGGRRGAATEEQEDEPVQPNWPDAAFPWCLRAQERTQAEKMKQEERLKWVKRFLERESDSDSAEDDQELWPPLQSHENDQVAHRRGRGKMVPLRPNPAAPVRALGEENMLVPSDPADARAALLSKRSVRTLSSRRREAQGLGEVEDVKCIGCARGDDGTELVQCDLCKEWYHLPCIGIRHVAELGREEDLWFCDTCLNLPPAPPVEPTFVPTDDRPLDQLVRPDSLFLQYEHSLVESPASWDVDVRPVGAAPQTPIRRRASGEEEDEDGGGLTHAFSTRSSRGAPKTPDSSAKTVRVYATPSAYALAFDRDGFDPDTPFDPTTTPSRGIKFSGGPPPTLGLSTPKGGVGLWAGRGGATPTPTPTLAARFGAGAGGSVGPRRLNWNDGRHAYETTPGAGAHSRSIYSGGYDDTPITRAPRIGERVGGLGGGGGRRLWDSPGFAPRRVGTPEGFGEGKRRGRGSDGDGDVSMENE